MVNAHTVRAKRSLLWRQASIAEWDDGKSKMAVAVQTTIQNVYDSVLKQFSLHALFCTKCKTFDECEDATHDKESVIQIEPRKADFYHNRGFAYRKQCNFDAAIADYSRAIELD